MIREDAYPVLRLPSFFHEFCDDEGNEIQHDEFLHRLQTYKATILQRFEVNNTTTGGTAKKGFTDLIFAKFIGLRSSFKLYQSSKFGYSYCPDILLIDPTTNLVIDVEIDEPYSYPDGTPIHCFESGANKDARRDEYFSELGIMVIRFAEEQVVRYPHECLNFIGDVVTLISDSKRTLADKVAFSSWSKLSDELSVSRWCEEEALKMAKYKYRSTYLPTKYLEAYHGIDLEIEEETAWIPMENTTSLNELAKLLEIRVNK